jgi:hypothetical protein
MAHSSKKDVDKFMLHIKKAVNLRAEAEGRSRSMYMLWRTSQDRLVTGAKLRKESDDMLREAEYMVYDLIDGAVEEEILK